MTARPVVLFFAFDVGAFGLIFGVVVTPFTHGCAAVWVGCFRFIEWLAAAGMQEAPA